MILASLLSSSKYIIVNKDLINTYGEGMTKQLIEQLSIYKQAKGKNYESDYAAILYWVTERIRELEKKNANYKRFKDKNNKNINNKNNFDQREYPPDFFESLYCNKWRKKQIFMKILKFFIKI